MPRIVIVYDSKSGNTERMAKAVEEGAKTLKGVETELHKVGTPFSISVLNKADAIVLGSPSRYGVATMEMKEFLDAATELKKAEVLRLEGKKGGVFGSYAWDGGTVVDRLAEALKALGVDSALQMVSAVDRMGSMGIRIDAESLQRCRELGKAIAEKLVKS